MWKTNRTCVLNTNCIQLQASKRENIQQRACGMCWWRDKDERQHRDQQTTAQIRSNPAPQQHAIISGTCTPTLGHHLSNRLTRAHTLCMLWAIGWIEDVTDLPTSPKIDTISTTILSTTKLCLDGRTHATDN